MLLTPRDILTRDDTWINKEDLLKDFQDIPSAIPDEDLRAQVDNYFRKVLVRDAWFESDVLPKRAGASH
ncbi:MAG: hypothetical protein ABI831_21675 [Betaproteobacteria bacterium]